MPPSSPTTVGITVPTMVWSRAPTSVAASTAATPATRAPVSEPVVVSGERSSIRSRQALARERQKPLTDMRGLLEERVPVDLEDRYADLGVSREEVGEVRVRANPGGAVDEMADARPQVRRKPGLDVRSRAESQVLDRRIDPTGALTLREHGEVGMVGEVARPPSRLRIGLAREHRGGDAEARSATVLGGTLAQRRDATTDALDSLGAHHVDVGLACGHADSRVGRAREVDRQWRRRLWLEARRLCAVEAAGMVGGALRPEPPQQIDEFLRPRVSLVVVDVVAELLHVPRRAGGHDVQRHPTAAGAIQRSAHHREDAGVHEAGTVGEDDLDALGLPNGRRRGQDRVRTRRPRAVVAAAERDGHEDAVESGALRGHRHAPQVVERWLTLGIAGARPVAVAVAG